MAVNGVTENANLIPEIWATDMYEELRNNLILANFFNRDYEGLIKKKGDTVHVNQITAPSGEEVTDDKQLIASEQMNINQIDVVANRIARASFEFSDLAMLQSAQFEADAQEALVYAVMKIVENRVISSISPSTSAPDHVIAPSSASDLAAADIAGIRTLLSTAKVPKAGRGLFLAPSYFGDLLSETNFVNSQYIPAGSPTASGEFSTPLYGFGIAEHDLLGADIGYAAHRSALTVVMQKGISLKISDLHPANKEGYLMTASLVFGVKQMDNKRVVKISG